MEKKNMYDVRGNRRPVSDLTEEERQKEIENCKLQLTFLYQVRAGERPTKLSGLELKTEIESFERYLTELTRKERTEEMFAVLNEFGNE